MIPAPVAVVLEGLTGRYGEQQGTLLFNRMATVCCQDIFVLQNVFKGLAPHLEGPQPDLIEAGLQ